MLRRHSVVFVFATDPKFPLVGDLLEGACCALSEAKYFCDKGILGRRRSGRVAGWPWWASLAIRAAARANELQWLTGLWINLICSAFCALSATAAYKVIVVNRAGVGICSIEGLKVAGSKLGPRINQARAAKCVKGLGVGGE